MTISPEVMIYSAMDGGRRQMVEQGEQLLGAALTLARQLRGSWTRWKVCRSWTTKLLGAELPTTWTGCTSSPTAGSWASAGTRRRAGSGARTYRCGLVRSVRRVVPGWEGGVD